MNELKEFPGEKELIRASERQGGCPVLKVNNHIHTPHSFSAFRNIREAVEMASMEEVGVLGINDFYVTDGYGEFIRQCREFRVFPLLNVELIGISKADQEKGIRINDPNNPGRTYISGKGLGFPSVLPPHQQDKLDRVVAESNRQVTQMIDLLNGWLTARDTGISLSVKEIMEDQAGRLLRERHVAKALRLKLERSVGSDEEFNRLIGKVYGGVPTNRERHDIPGLEDELRARLLKSGAPAFVPEDEDAFLPIEEIIQIIRDAGGIPTYPMLLDGAGGAFTEFEEDRERLLDALQDRGFRSVELIPLRNRIDVLRAYAGYFYDNGFVVSFGTEHNTSATRPLTVDCKEGVHLDDQLTEISFRGAAYQAAHQYLSAREQATDGRTRAGMEELGAAVIHHYMNQ